MKEYSMLEDSPGRTLFYFALPMIIGNLFQQFYNMADSIIVGQFVSEEALEGYLHISGVYKQSGMRFLWVGQLTLSYHLYII